MFKIRPVSSNDYIDLKPGYEIEFVDNINLFSFLNVQGDFTYDFEIDWTPKNKRLLQFAFLPESQFSRYESIEVILELAGTTWKRGLLYFLNGDKYKARVQFIGANGTLAKEIENKSLRDLNWPIVTFTDGEMPFHAAEVVTDGYSQWDYTFFTIWLETGSETVFLNRWLGIDQTFTGLFYSPQFYVFNVLKKIAEYFGFKLDAPFFSSDEMRRLVLLNSRVLNSPKLDLDGYEDIADSYDVKKAVPDVKVADFLKSIARYFNLWIDFDLFSRVLRIRRREDLITIPTRINWQKSLLSFENEYIKNKKLNYTLKFKVDDSELSLWDESNPTGISSSTWLQNPIAIADSEEIDVGMGTVLAFPNKGYSVKVSGGIEDDLPLYLLFYRGIEAFAPGEYQRPFATSIKHGTDQLTTHWTGADNVIDKEYKIFLDRIKFMKNGRADMILDLEKILTYQPQAVYTLDRFNCIFKSLRYKISEHKIKNAQAELLYF